jgi:predicted small secreted protein
VSNNRDNLRHYGFFLSMFLLGGIVFAVVSCGTLAGLGEDAKKAGRWLPDPYGAIAESAGTVLLMFAGHKTVRHIRKRSKAKATRGR